MYNHIFINVTVLHHTSANLAQINSFCFRMRPLDLRKPLVVPFKFFRPVPVPLPPSPALFTRALTSSTLL